ncbi:MAG: SH3 domain-containing protein [Patescibacteria group bacterium]
MNKLLISLSTFALLLTSVPPARAGMDCYVDPVYQYSGGGTISSAVFMRDNACTDGTTILSTVSAGTSVQVVGFTDGWYRIETNGGRGWVGQQFVSTSASRTGKVWDSYTSYMSEVPSVKPGATTPPPSTGTDAALVSRLKGYILLQTQQHGEAWYLDPVASKRYYMKDGPTAYQMMRSFGLGMTETDYAKLAADDWSLKNRLRGRIVLRVQAHGEAYYIHPKDLTVYYLQNGDEAYRIMRLYSLGITDADLAKIPSATIPVK